MKIAQGSLEYLVLIAVALGIISVVTLIAVNYLGAQQGQYSYNSCKNAAANCKVALIANPNDKCSYCDVECKASDGTDIFTNAPLCCKMGKPDLIYEGATGDECAGCFDDSECTPPAICNLATHTCAAPACFQDSDCPDPNPATTGDGACVSGQCINDGQYDAYCDEKYAASGTSCGTTAYGSWYCPPLSSSQQCRTKTTYVCSSTGTCTTSTTLDCQTCDTCDRCTGTVCSTIICTGGLLCPSGCNACTDTWTGDCACLPVGTPCIV